MSIKDSIATKGHRILIPSTTTKESLTTDTQRTPRSGEMYAEGPGNLYFGLDISDNIHKAVERCMAHAN